MAASNWKNTKAYTPVARLLAIATGAAAIIAFGYFVFMISDVHDVFAPDNPFGPIVFAMFVLPFIGLAMLNGVLLHGVLHKRTVAFIIAAILLPLEWMTALVLGGNAVSSGLFNGKQYLAIFPHHTPVLVAVFILFVGLSFYLCGKELRAAQAQKRYGNM